jgi:hypothetical protein
MRGTAKGVRLALSDDVLRKLCQLSTIKGYVKDEAQFRSVIKFMVDDSWFLHAATKVIPWQQLIKLKMHEWNSETSFEGARDQLKAALNDPQATMDILASHTDAFQKALRKLQSARDRFAEARSFLDRIESDEQKAKFIEAWRVAVKHGFGKTSYRPAPLIEIPPIGLWGEAQRHAKLSAAIGAIVFNIQSDEQRDRFLKEYLLGQLSPRQRGRPIQSKTHLECRLFVRDLLNAVNNAGGKLSFDKNLERGTLLDALRLLAPFVPAPATRGLRTCPSEDLPPGLPGLLAEVRADWLADRASDK